MSSLADELLDDLDGLSGGEEEQEEVHQPPQFKVPGLPASALKRKREGDDEEDTHMSDGDDEDEQGGLVLEGGVKPADELDKDDVEEMKLGAVTDVRNVAKLEGSKRMKDILQVNVIRSFICNVCDLAIHRSNDAFGLLFTRKLNTILHNRRPLSQFLYLLRRILSTPL